MMDEVPPPPPEGQCVQNADRPTRLDCLVIGEVELKNERMEDVSVVNDK